MISRAFLPSNRQFRVNEHVITIYMLAPFDSKLCKRLPIAFCWELLGCYKLPLTLRFLRLNSSLFAREHELDEGMIFGGICYHDG